MNRDGRERLHVQMFGSFSVSYGGKEIVLSRNTSAKFIQLLQFVWLSGEKGVTKEQLIEALYDREEVANVNNSLNNLLYQMRRQMGNTGLPAADYIIHQGMMYVTDESVPLTVDALEFEKLIKRGQETEDEQERYFCYRKAFELYKGELLPGIAGQFWVTIESVRFKRKFEECAVWLGEYEKDRKEYLAMEEIYRRLAELYPFEEWQVCQIDAMLLRGDYKEAYALYDRTVKLYSDELGLPPTGRMLECYERMGSRLANSQGSFAGVQTELEAQKCRSGGWIRMERFFVPTPVSSMPIAC